MAAGANHSQFVAHLTTILNSVTGIGTVIGLPRDKRDIEDIKDTFGSGTPKIINAWVIQREKVNILRTGAPTGHEFRSHQYVIRGYYQLNDDLSSDNTFQELINDILDAFLATRQKATGAAVAFFEDTDSIIVRMIDVAHFSGFYVHYCEIAVSMRERISKITYHTDP
jgi:hypothetical protein